VRFFGYDLELTVETILASGSAPSLFTASDPEGAAWLVAQVGYEGSHLAWLCARTSERARQAVVEGSAAARDAIRHSLTGTVELVTVTEGGAARDQCLLCGELTDELLSSVPAYVALPAAS
jgi:hypothetical protein